MFIRLLPSARVKSLLLTAIVQGFVLAGQDAAADDPIVVVEAQVSLLQNTVVAAPLSGRVANLDVREGVQIAAGDLIAGLEDELVRREVAAAESASRTAQLEAENDVDARYARRTLEVRKRELQQSLDANLAFPGSVSDTEIEKLKLVVDQSRLAIEQAEQQQQVALSKLAEKRAAVEIVRTRLRQHRITAPIAGQVIEVSVDVGEWVEAGKPVARLISLDPLRVECFVDGRRFGSELVGRHVEFTPNSDVESATDSATETDDDLENVPEARSLVLRGTVDFVSPELNPVTGQVRLWATIKNPEQRLRAGMRGRLLVSDR